MAKSTKVRSTKVRKWVDILSLLYSTTRQDDFLKKLAKKYPLKNAVFAY